MQQLVLGKEVISKVIMKELSKINISVTYACNYRCKTCNIWRAYLEDPILRNGELTRTDYENLFEENRDFIWVSFTGGEPFLRKDFPEIVISALKNVEKLRVVNIATNGSMPERVEKGIGNVLSEMPKKVHLFIEVSLDGFETLHNNIRGNNKAHRKALETFLRLQRLKEELRPNFFNVKFEYTLSKFNSGMFEATLNELKNAEVPVDINDFVFTFAHNSYYYNNMQSDIKPETDLLLNDVSWILKHYQNRKFFDRVTKSYLKMTQKYFKEGWRPPCVVGEYSCFLDPFGNIYPCITMNFTLGNLKEDGFNLSQILKNSDSKIFRENLRPHCSTCWTSCEAYQTIVFNFPRFIKELL